MNFLQQFFEGTTHNIELRTVPAVARLFTRDEEEMNEFIKEHRATHLYFGCCTREGKTKGDKEHCRELVALWADIDFNKTEKPVADRILSDFAFKPSVQINSGGGYHVYWMLKESIDAHDLRCEPTLRGITMALQADISGAELARILRIPGTLNHKYKPARKVEILNCDFNLRYNLDDFEIFKVNSEKQAEKISLREGKIGPGDRTAAIVSLAGVMNRKGNTFEETEAAVQGLNTRFNPPHTAKYVAEKVKSIFEQYTKQHGNGAATTVQIDCISAAEITPEPLVWLWRNRVPLGKLTVFVGVPDTGKSTIGIDIAARCTTGRAWPDDEIEREPQEVLMLISEDDLTDTVVPRLMAAKANLDKVHFAIQTTIIDKKSGNQVARRIALDTDLKALETMLAERPEIKLIIADPLGSYLGKLKRNAEEDIRWVLTELKEMAERTKIAIISIDHFNKNAEQSAIHRLSGAGALAAVPRAVWGFVKDKEEKELRLMLNAKLNVVSEANKMGMKYRAVGVEFSIKNILSSLPVIEWMGASEGDLDEILHQEKDPDKRKLTKCGKWLQEFLGKKSVLSREIYANATEAGFSQGTVRRAVVQLGVTHTKTTAGWRMELNSDPLPSEPGEEEV